MRRLPELAQLPAKVFADRLYPEADAEDRQFFVQRRGNGFRNAEILRTAGAGRQHQEVVIFRLQHRQRVDVPDHRNRGADLPK